MRFTFDFDSGPGGRGGWVLIALVVIVAAAVVGIALIESGIG